MNEFWFVSIIYLWVRIFSGVDDAFYVRGHKLLCFAIGCLGCAGLYWFVGRYRGY